MNKLVKTFLAFAICAAAMVISSCHNSEATEKKNRPIVILYDNDVHCSVDGYAKMAGLRDAIAKADTAYVATVSAGDFLQGGLTGTLSQGKDIISIMNAVGYDVVTPGNHEFDYGMPVMLQALKDLKSDVVCTNLFDLKTKQPVYAPYVIKTFGKKKVAFVGVLTPVTMHSAYSAFYENGTKTYDVKSADEMTVLVQKAVDNARTDGAGYVVLLSHLGEKDNDDTSVKLIHQTHGIDAVLDGHTHSVIEKDMIANNERVMTPSTQTGTAFANIGKLYISPDGKCETRLLSTAEIMEENANVSQLLHEIAAKHESLTTKHCATSEQKMSIYDENCTRIIRNHEVGIGNFIADVVAAGANAPIALMSAGAIRADIPEGEVTYGDIMTVVPFENPICLVSMTGKQIQQVLELGASKYPGEAGEFVHVSGLRYTIVANASPKVQHVEVLQKDGSYTVLDSNATYTVACSEYAYQTLEEKPVVINPNVGLAITLIPETIVTKFNGHIDRKYAKPEGRIIIK